MRCVFSAALILGSVFANLASHAGDNCPGQPVSQPVPQSVVVQRSTITVSTVSTPVVAQPQKLDSLKQQVDAFTENCTNERKTAEQALTAAKEQVTKSEQAQALQFKRISFVRDLMNAPCVDVCLNGQMYSKDTIALVLTEMIGTYEKGEATHKGLNDALAVAQAGLEKAVEKEARWVANQKALTSKVDAIAAAIKKRDQLAADVKRTEEARKALDEAFKLADKLAKEAEGASGPTEPKREIPTSTSIVKPADVAGNQVQNLIDNVENAIRK